MRLKSYFAPTVESAMEQARRELGSEAMLVHSRRTGPEASNLGDYEVVFAVPAGPAPVKPPAPPRRDEPATNVDALVSQLRAAAAAQPLATTGSGAIAEGPGPAGAPAPWDRLYQEVSGLRRQLELTNRAVAHPTKGALTGALADIVAALGLLELESTLAQDIAEAVFARIEEHWGGSAVVRVPAEDLRHALQAEIMGRIRVEAALGRPDSDQRIVALVGPPGAGKTTNLVKLAFRYGLTARKPIQILSIDHVRIGAADHLRTYAGILGVGFEAVETVGALAQAIEAHRGKDLILIDTPGYSLKDMDDCQEVAGFLSSHPDIDTHLVLMASLKSADLRRMADGFARFGPRKMVFSQVDQTERIGTAWSESIRFGRPISFLSTGQSIPEDIEEATQKSIVERLVSSTMPGGRQTPLPKPLERPAGRKAAGTGAAA